jgi:nitrogen fixation/metabolism regulation signal transduction histidine kinase
MFVFFIWIGLTVILLALYSLRLWKRNKKQSRFQAKLTVLFLLFMMIPAVPLTLFVANLLTQSADMLLLPGIGHALETSLSTIRLQAEQRGRLFFEAHQDPEAWNEAHLQKDQIFFAGLYRVSRDSIFTVRRIRMPGCTVPKKWTPGMESFREPSDSLQSGCISTPEGETWMSVCRSFPGPSLAVVGYAVSPSVLGAKQEITRALSVYNTLTLLKENIIKKNIIWAVASLLLVALSILAVTAAKKLSRGISEPIQDLVSGMHRVASGDFSREVQTRARDEIRFLVDSFNGMMHELQHTRQKLLQAEKLAAWQEAARRISHEIRNSLTPVFVSLRRIKTASHGTPPSEAVTESLATLEEELVSLESISSAFSDFARLPQPQKIRLNMNDVVSTAARTAEHETDSVHCRTDLFPGPLTLEADRDQMKRLLHNLIKNAVEASPRDGEVVVRTRREHAPSESIVVEIEDHGAGMDADVLKKLFQPYFTTKNKGTGLGLVIAQKIAEDHSGRIEVRSQKGAGTLMRVVLPAVS